MALVMTSLVSSSTVSTTGCATRRLISTSRTNRRAAPTLGAWAAKCVLVSIPESVTRPGGSRSASKHVVCARRRKGRTGCMDAITLLKQDHKTVEGLFKKFEKAGDGARKAQKDLADKITKE